MGEKETERLKKLPYVSACARIFVQMLHSVLFISCAILYIYIYYLRLSIIQLIAELALQKLFLWHHHCY
jgi:hypothetical protein